MDEEEEEEEEEEIEDEDEDEDEEVCAARRFSTHVCCMCVVSTHV
jgi:hypothetical protein